MADVQVLNLNCLEWQISITALHTPPNPTTDMLACYSIAGWQFVLHQDKSFMLTDVLRRCNALLCWQGQFCKCLCRGLLWQVWNPVGRQDVRALEMSSMRKL